MALLELAGVASRSKWLRARETALEHSKPLLLIATALVLMVVSGVGFAVSVHIPLWLGWSCALANGVTVGGTVLPVVAHPWTYFWWDLQCAVLPLLCGAAISYFSSSLTAKHVRRAKQEIKEHVSQLSCPSCGASLAVPDGDGTADKQVTV